MTQRAYLLQELERLKSALIDLEAEYVDRQAEINAFEFEFEARVGHILDQLADLEKEIDRYQDLIETIRNRDVFGQAYLSAEKQHQRAWEKPPQSAPQPPPIPPTPKTEAEIKALYRRLARQYHPDLAQNEQDREFRTEMMTAINNAYAARNIQALLEIAQQLSNTPPSSSQKTDPTDLETEAMQAEISRYQQKLASLQADLRRLEKKPSVQLALEVKLALSRGEDLFATLAKDLQQKLARKTAERDLLKTQVDQLGPDQGFIPINR
ncbi:MAG: DnaJ domain-containing protein [Chloroflexota bacterium]